MKAPSEIAQTTDTVRRPRIAVAGQREAVLEAATALFLELGFDGVSLDTINRAVGGSKRDLYKLFADKADLFGEVVSLLAAERASRMQTTIVKGGSVEESLGAAGRSFLQGLMEPRTIALHKLLVTDGERAPQAAANFLREGPSRAYAAMADVLAAHAAAGQIEIADPVGSARLFLDAISGALQLRALLGQPVTEGQIDEVVDAASQTFVEGWRPRPQAQRHP